MVTKIVDVKEVQAHWAELLALVQEGTEIILLQDDKPLARLTLLETGERVLDLHPNSMWTSDDFDAPLPDAFWLEDEGGSIKV